jgi:hypothetical protein
MTTIAIPSIRTPARTRASLQNDRLFYSGMAVAMILTVFVGFAQSYFLKSYFGGRPLGMLVHVHGAASTAWLLLFFTQTALVAARRTDIHRKLGLAGAALAVVLLILGIATAIAAFRAGRTPPGWDPRSHLVMPFWTIGTFALFVGIAIIYRKQPETHKRLMLLATIAMLTPAIGRLPIISGLGYGVYFAIQDLFVLAGVVYDFASRRRVHPAYIWGGLFIIIMQPMRLFISQTPLWLAFGDWLR